MRNIKLLSGAMLIISLSACIKAPTLDERLAGKTGDERKKEAYYACIQRAHSKIPGGHSSSYIGHESRMATICDAMHKVNLTQEN